MIALLWATICAVAVTWIFVSMWWIDRKLSQSEARIQEARRKMWEEFYRAQDRNI